MLKEINQNNIQIFYNLAQAYEAEFSSITKKLPDNEGKFALDTMPQSPIKSYLWYDKEAPVGFALLDLSGDLYNVNEFYIIPSVRNKNLGEKLFLEVLHKHQGNWQVKQLTGATLATKFWRKVIAKYTDNNFQEDIYEDGYWGTVTRQVFKTKP